MKVNHENFNTLAEEVKKGERTFFIFTYTKATKIDKACFERFNKVGKKPLWLSKDGTGFLLASGKKSVYVLPGYLEAV